MPKHIFKKSDKIIIDDAEVSLEGLEVDVDTNYCYRGEEVVKHFAIMKRDIGRSGRKDIGVMYMDLLDLDMADPRLLFPSEIPIIESQGNIPRGITDPIAYRADLIIAAQDTEYPYTLMIPILTRGSSHFELLAVEILDNQKHCNVFVIDSSKAPKSVGDSFLRHRIAPMLTQAGLQVDIANSAFCQPASQAHGDSVYGNVACGAYVVNNAENIINYGLDSIMFSQEVNSTPAEVTARDAALRSEQFMKLIAEGEDIPFNIHGVRNSQEVLGKLGERLHETANVEAIEEIEQEIAEISVSSGANDTMESRDKIIALTKNVISATHEYFPNFTAEQMHEAFNFACQMMAIYGDPFEKAQDWKASILNLGIVEPLASEYLKMAETFQIQLANEALDNNVFSSDGGWFKMTDLKPKELEILSKSAIEKKPCSRAVEGATAYPIASKAAGIEVC